MNNKEDIVRGMSDEEYEKVKNKYCLIEIKNHNVPEAVVFWIAYCEGGIDEQSPVLEYFGEIDSEKLLKHCIDNNYKLSAFIISKNEEESKRNQLLYLKMFRDSGVLMETEKIMEAMAYVYKMLNQG